MNDILIKTHYMHMKFSNNKLQKGKKVSFDNNDHFCSIIICFVLKL